MKKSSIFHCDPEILGGTVVFTGTRVPLQNLIDYLEGGYTLGEFLDDFPSVTGVQAIQGLEEACYRGHGIRCVTLAVGTS